MYYVYAKCIHILNHLYTYTHRLHVYFYQIQSDEVVANKINGTPLGDYAVY